MLDESEFPRLVEFTGLPLRKGLPFSAEQKGETERTGRDGKARFNRRGLVGEWREWWTEEQGEWLASLLVGLQPTELSHTKNQGDANSRKKHKRKSNQTNF
jgi:hypothetical protein